MSQGGWGWGPERGLYRDRDTTGIRMKEEIVEHFLSHPSSEVSQSVGASNSKCAHPIATAGVRSDQSRNALVNYFRLGLRAYRLRKDYYSSP